jgi:CMP-N-acetylneuraminic acid synthetase
MITALLFIKAHSERVPDKNFRFLGNKPLFARMVETLQSVPQIERIVVNSDAITRLQEMGLKESHQLILKDRHPDLLGDKISANQLIERELQEESAVLFLMTHVTSPFLSAHTIGRAIAAFLAGQGDSLFGVSRLQARLYGADFEPLNHDPKELKPTQDLAPIYEENSSLYLFTKAGFEQTESRVGQSPILFETPPLESLDIDTEADWKLAEALVQR